ncbi:MAG: 4-hydroxy-3-methylbut-2-enyl diphosphate reductase, partial [Acidaminococcales bacterium]|nr:4-hydroxy-3-methylbut-2-enyl diphosphate reductase [Acidaminococcales bacterium]
MEILLAKTMGFCQGVKRAVGMAAESGAGSYVLGQLTHNPQVNKMVAEKGVQMTRSLYGLREGSRVVFRAHGEPPNSYLVAKSRLLEIVDATCPHVKNAQTAAQKLAKEDLCVIVIGDPLHPEVMSIKAWAGDKAVVVQNAAEVDKLPEEGRYGVISQTTCTDELFDELSALIAQKAAEHKIVRTICPATRERQASAVELAQSSDAVVVVGGRNSANTKKIKEIAEKHCKNTILVETAQELSKDMFLNTKIVGVTAGASTPDWIIEEVVKEMEDMGEMLEQNDDGKKMSLNAGDIVQGKVVGVGKDEVFVDINYKSEGIVPRAEIALNPPEDLNLAVSPGDVITVMTLDPDKDGIVLLSKVKADAQMALEKLNTIYENKETINVFVDAAVKGGVTCELSGLRGFIPASHLGLERV